MIYVNTLLIAVIAVIFCINVGVMLMSKTWRRWLAAGLLVAVAIAYFAHSSPLLIAVALVAGLPLIFRGALQEAEDVTNEPDEESAPVISKATGYAERVLIGLDQFINTLLGGEPDETLSSLAYRLERDRGHEHWRFSLPRKVIDRLFWFQPQHCQNAYLSECRRSQLAPEFRQTSQGIQS